MTVAWMRQRRQVESSNGRAEAATPDASSRAMDVGSEIEPVEYDEIQCGPFEGLRNFNRPNSTC